MKKLVTIALLAAMLLSCFAGCAMQKGEIDVEAYAGEAGAQNVEFRTELSDDADVWDGSTVDRSWYDNDPTKKEYEISTAAQLRGLYAIMQALASKTSCLEGVTIKLTKDIDLGGKRWSAPASEKYFAGTFDGQGHVIANWYNTITGAGYQSFFGSITGNACIKNVTIIGGTITDALNTSDSKNKDTVGSLVTRAKVEEGKTITISNVYTDVDFTVNKDKVQEKLTKVGGMVGVIQGADGDVVIENCQNAGTIHSRNGNAAGIVNWINGPRNVTIKGCSVTGSISSDAGTVGGIVGYLQKETGSLTIENCSVTAPLSGKSSYTAGIIAYTKESKNITIKNCSVNSTISGTTQTGGIIGQLAAGGSAGNVVVEGCVVSGSVTGTTMSGGIIGYTDKKSTSLTIKDCEMKAAVTGQRTSGGVIGTLNLAGAKATIKNVHVSGALFFDLKDTKNNAAGGLIGKLQNTSVMISDCSVDSVMKATFTPGTPADGSDTISGAAGLIGRVFDRATAEITNCSVAGNFEFTTAGNAHGLTFNVGRMVGSLGEGVTVKFVQDNTLAKDLAVTLNGNAADFVYDAEGTLPSIMGVGYQKRENGDGTYDLRYIFAAKDYFDGVGVKAELRFKTAEGDAGAKYQTFYVDTVYSYIMDEENLFAAADYGFDYLYTLVVSGVPAEYNFDAKNLQVILKTFGSNNVDGAITTQWGGIQVQGDPVGNTVAQDMNITIDNFSATLDDKFTAEGSIFIAGDTYDQQVSVGVTDTYARPAECRGDYATGGSKESERTYHYYLDGSTTTAGRELLNLTYNFRVTETGWYDICIDMRMKGTGDTSDGSNQRNSLLLIDWAAGAAAYDVSFELENVKDIKTDSAGSYMTGVKVYLEAGEHTISFTSNEGFTNNNYHVRNIYLALAD